MTEAAIADWSARSRLGVRGEDLARWVKANGMELGAQVNVAYPCGSNSLLARLSRKELLYLNCARDDVDERAKVLEDYRCYTVSRRDSHSWFNLSGEAAHALLAKICGVDFSLGAFANHRVAQTSVARVSGLVIRDDHIQGPAFHLLVDSTYREYLWSACINAGAEPREW